METWLLANRHSDLVGLGCHLAVKVVQKWFCVKHTGSSALAVFWSCSGQAHSVGLSVRASVSTACAPGSVPGRKRMRQLNMRPRSCSQGNVSHQRKVSSALPTSPADTGSPMPWWLLTPRSHPRGSEWGQAMQGKSPEAFLQSPYLRGGPERAGSLCVFSASFFFLPFPPHTQLSSHWNLSSMALISTLWSQPLLGFKGSKVGTRVSISLCLLALTSSHPYHLQSLPPFSPLSALGICLWIL